MLKRILLCLATMTLLFSSTVFADDLKLGGGNIPFEKVVVPVKTAFQQKTGTILAFKSYGVKFALLDLVRDEIAGAVLLLNPAEVAGVIKKEGIALDPAALQATEVGKDVAKIIVNKGNQITSLTKEQAKGIFTGKITNWKDVGGKDTPIIIVYSEIQKGLNELFIKHVLGGEPFTKEVLEAASAKEAKGIVATTPEAIGLSAISTVDATVKSLDNPEIIVPVIIYSKGKPTANLQKLIDFIKAEGPK
jgi:phosphate transport system substrate-binding protein